MKWLAIGLLIMMGTVFGGCNASPASTSVEIPPPPGDSGQTRLTEDIAMAIVRRHLSETQRKDTEENEGN